MEIEINKLSFNELPKSVRLKHLKPTFMDPFNLPDNAKFYNPYTLKLFGVWGDGEHIMHNVSNCKIFRKFIVKCQEVTRVWSVTSNNEWVEVYPKEDGSWDVNCFKD